jgi:hypothetical protein
MSVIGRRDWILAMKFDDETRRGREALNKGLGDISKTSKKATEDAKRSIVDIAKASKTGMEGIKAVLELGGWLMIAKAAGKAFMDITAEARKNSVAFKEAGSALSLMKKEIGSGLVKALEPLAAGFKDVLVVGIAVFRNFPEVAKATFKYVGAIISKTFSWQTIKSLFFTLGEGIVSVFRSAFEYIPKLFMGMIKLLLTPIKGLGDYLGDTISKAFAGKFSEIEDPFKFFQRTFSENVSNLKDLAAGFGGYVMEQAGNLKETVSKVGDIYQSENNEFSAALRSILAADIGRIGADVTSGAAGGGAAIVATIAPAGYSVMRRAVIDGMGYADDAIAARVAASRAGDGMASASNPLLDSIMGGIGPFVEMLGGFASMVEPIKMIKQLLDPLSIILEGFFSVIGPAITGTLKPLFDALFRIGELVGKALFPIFDALYPIISIIAQILMTSLGPWLGYLAPIVQYISGLFTLLAPIIKAVAIMMEVLQAPLRWLGDLFTWVANAIKVAIHNLVEYIEHPISEANRDIWSNPAFASDAFSGLAGRIAAIWNTNYSGSLATDGLPSSSSSSMSSASYAAGTSIKIEKIEINAGVVVGEPGIRELAVMIRDEIVEAERLGA